MNLSHLSPAAFAAGLAALAGGLYLLQRLRVRHARVEVVTTLFWKQVLEDTHARELTQRFRHLPAYLLLVAVAASLWSGVAGVEAERDSGRRTVLLLDQSSLAAVGDRWDGWGRLLLELHERCDPDRTTVVACGALPRTLASEGEATPVLRERLAGLEPELTAPSMESTLLGLLRTKHDLEPWRLVLVGEAPVTAALVEALPEDVELTRATLPTSSALDAPGLLAVGAGHGAAWTEATVLVRARGASASAGADPAPELILDGQPWTAAPFQEGAAWRYEGLPANGGLLEVRLPGARAPHDRARLALPVRTPVLVAVEPALEPLVGAVLDAHPGLQRSDEGQAEVVIRSGGASLGSGLPALELAPASAGSAAVELQVPSEAVPSSAVLSELLVATGLDRLAGSELATQVGRTLEATLSTGPVRGVRLWTELVEPSDEGLRASRAFPLLVARALEWLRAAPALVPEARAGSTLPVELATPEQRLAAPSARVALLRAAAASARGTALPEVSVLPEVTAFAPEAAGNAAELPAPVLEAGTGWGLGTWLLLLGLALILTEERLLRLGRMP